jgi:endo-alpha-1,4-polygalactosaminidase (GH114 family)
MIRLFSKLNRVVPLLLVVVVAVTFLGFMGYSNGFRGVKSYKIYYGVPTKQILSDMKQYDLVILEPHNYSKEDITYIKNRGTIVLGYMSIMQLGAWNKTITDKVRDEDYVTENGEKVQFDEWKTYLMDISNPHYRSAIMKDMEIEVVNKGCDGMFLDTVGDIDSYFDSTPDRQTKMRNGLADYLKQITKDHPKLLLMQNFAFETLKSTTLPYVKGIMWEDFVENDMQTDKWSQEWAQQLAAFQKERKLTVFTVTPDQKGIDYSRKKGFVPYLNPNSNYDTW